MQLKANTAPVFMHVPPQGKTKEADTLNIQAYVRIDSTGCH